MYLKYVADQLKDNLSPEDIKHGLQKAYDLGYYDVDEDQLKIMFPQLDSTIIGDFIMVNQDIGLFQRKSTHPENVCPKKTNRKSRLHYRLHLSTC